MALVALASFVLLLAILWLALKPFLIPVAAHTEELSSDLDRQRGRLVEVIRELDMDFATGKLTEKDYGVLRNRYKNEAALTFEAIARAEEEASVTREEAPLPPGGEDGATALKDEIESSVRARKMTLAATRCALCGAERDEADRFCRVCGNELPHGDGCSGGALS